MWLAVVASIFVHMIVALSLAAFNRASTPLPMDEDKPVELTMVDLSATPPPSAKANPAYVETDPSKETPDEPEEKTFESNANSKAASNEPASGDAPVPSQAGNDRPFLQMETQQSSIAMESSAAQPPPQPTPAPIAAATPPPVQTPPPVETPKPRPSEAPKPTPLPEPEATPDLSKFAMLTSTPPPALRDPEDAESPPPEVGPTAPPIVSRPMPERPATAYQPEKQQTRMTGRITDRGPSSVNAVGTPLGKYQKQVSDAIGSRWYYYMKSKIDLVSIGTAHVEAEVDAQGKVQKLRVVSNNANEAFANVCLQSFQEAQIPPIPPDVVAALPGGRLPVDIFFTTYANQ
jgi:outer membrane biosynthesis protein TonB